MKKGNIRQIGQIKGTRCIYIEDYAMSYLKQMAEPNVPYARMAVLVGEVEKETKGEAVYVYGVLEFSSGEQGVGYQMDSAAWTRLYAEMGRHFPDREIVGWYLTGEDLIPEKHEWLLRFHRENFAGEDKIFFYYNPSELEEIGYFYEEGQLKPQSGYYIFYEKNEAMQNLLVAKHKEEYARIQLGTSWQSGEDRSDTAIWQRGADRGDTANWQREEDRDDTIDWQRREIERDTADRQTEDDWQREKRRESKVSSYLAGMATAVAVLALCLVALQYFDRLDGLEESIRQLTGNLTETTTMGQTKDSQKTEEPSENEDLTEQGELQKEDNTKQESTQKEEGKKENANQSEEHETKENETEENKSGGVLEVETLPGGIVSDSTEEEAQKEEKENEEREESEEDETAGIEPVEE